jgi:hypothetical protein
MDSSITRIKAAVQSETEDNLLHKLREEMNLAEKEYNEIKVISDTALEKVNKLQRSVNERRIKVINSKSSGVVVKEVYKIAGIGKVIMATTLDDIIITDLKTSDGNLINVKGCEDSNGEESYLGQRIRANTEIVIFYRNCKLNKGDILTPI